jgi:hypothetical protein
MKKDIGYYPYKVQIVQKLLPTDSHFFMGLPEGKGIPNKAQDLTETKGLYSQRNP